MVFDLDGVLLESEQVWNEAKRELVEEHDGHWRDSAPRNMMGMSSPEWSRYLRDELGVDIDLDRISGEVVARVEATYRRELPFLEGAREAVERGKPAPDVYLEALRRLEAAPEASTAVEDSNNGIRAARVAGMRVVALPNPAYPPGDEALGLADVVIHALDELTPALVAG